MAAHSSRGERCDTSVDGPGPPSGPASAIGNAVGRQGQGILRWFCGERHISLTGICRGAFEGGRVRLGYGSTSQVGEWSKLRVCGCF